jgi:serine/threonine-protein kinase PRP4
MKKKKKKSFLIIIVVSNQYIYIYIKKKITVCDIGLKYEYPVDMWSVGCLLYELYTSRVLFPGKSNNDMMRLYMELKGKFSHKILRKSLFRERYFDEEFRFVHREREREGERERVRVVGDIKVRESLADKLKGDSTMSLELKTRLDLFIDFLDKVIFF